MSRAKSDHFHKKNKLCIYLHLLHDWPMAKASEGAAIQKKILQMFYIIKCFLIFIKI